MYIRVSRAPLCTRLGFNDGEETGAFWIKFTQTFQPYKQRLINFYQPTKNFILIPIKHNFYLFSEWWQQDWMGPLSPKVFEKQDKF